MVNEKEINQRISRVLDDHLSKKAHYVYEEIGELITSMQNRYAVTAIDLEESAQAKHSDFEQYDRVLKAGQIEQAKEDVDELVRLRERVERILGEDD